MAKKYPKKGLGSYMIPFLLIIILIGSGAYILQNRVDFDDVKRIFMPPEVAKDEKVTIAFQQGNNEMKSWNETSWEILGDESYIQAGDTLKTGDGSALVLRFFENSELRMDKNSELKFIRLDKDEITGNHLAVEVINGQVWGRVIKPNTSDGDFIINTPQQLIQLEDDSLINVSMNPETSRVVGGKALVNVAEMSNGTRRPVARLTVEAGQQLTLDQLTIDQLKSDERDVQIPLSESFLNSEWYEWNTDKEEKLGSHVSIVEVSTVELEPLAEGLISLTSHKAGQVVSGKILVQGSFDAEKIDAVYVNNIEATLGLNGEWEAGVTLSDQNKILKVTAKESGSNEKKDALSLELTVDDLGPGLGAVTQPVIDENGNGTLESDKLELIGEVSADALSVCVSHNDATPYCLQQFAKGDTTYRYLGAVTYGNVKAGKNKYTITAKDALGNISSKTVYLFKGVEKPASKIIEDTSSTPTTSTTGSELSRPVIVTPDPNEVIQVTEPSLVVSGTTDSASRSLLINGKKAEYTAGSADFSVTLDLELGENLIKIQSVDSSGEKSKTALLTVIYLEALETEEE